MSDNNKEKSTKYTMYDSMSTEMLEKMIRLDFQDPASSEKENERILYILDIIANREKDHPSGQMIDVDIAWQSFNENYRPFINDDRSLYDDDENTDKEETDDSTDNFYKSEASPAKHKHIKLIRVASVVLSIVAVAISSTIVASAFGVNLWGIIARWSNETFSFFLSEASPTGEQADIAENGVSFRDLEEALSYYGINASLAPTWFPKGYAISQVNVFDTPQRITFNALYSRGDNEIVVNIISLRGNGSVYEKDEEEVKIYLINGIEHYIMTNVNRRVAVWTVDNYECSISGILTEDEMMKMIDSIYER